MSKLGLIHCGALIKQRQPLLEWTKTKISNFKDFSMSLLVAGP